MTALRGLQRLTRGTPRQTFAEHAERCEVCAAFRLEEHGHVVDRATRKLCCVCAPCAIAFQGTRIGRYLGVPTRVAVDPTFCLTSVQWDALEIPVRLAFLMRQSSLERWLAFVPSPVGATEVSFEQAPWLELVAGQTLLRTVRDDVEAVLVRGNPSGPFDCLVAPVDVCYELVALVRRYWRGFEGGEQLRPELDRFFSRLNERSEIVFDRRDTYRSSASVRNVR